MAWNEPGGNNNDPWGNKKNDGGPPDLDEVFRNLRKRLDGLLGGKKGASGSSGGTGSGSGGDFKFPGKFGSAGLLGLGLILGAIWLLSGIYIIQPAERGVITQFGKYKHTTGPGPHIHWPWPIQKLQRENIDEKRVESLINQDILTRDENIVVIDIVVNYVLSDAKNYLFNVSNPNATLKSAAESALRETVGLKTMDSVLTIERELLADETQVKLQQTLDDYEAGIRVTAVNLERAAPPEKVKGAFEDVVKAREDAERFINEAQAYRAGVVPKARGEAVVMIEQARAYQAEVVNAATGEAARFESLLTEYTKAPEITKERLYIESMESVLSKSSKVMVGTGDSGNNLMYLPIDKLMGGSERQNNNQAPAVPNEYTNPSNKPPVSSPTTSNRFRTRETY